MRVAFVVQRYGENVVGGAEQGCRQLAQMMSNDWNVSVLTTCASDYMSWQNVFPAGKSMDGKIQVHRFPVDKVRDFGTFSKSSSQQERFAYRLSADEEAQRFIDQGPYTPQLVSYIESKKDDYDVFIFYTYLYYTTVAALPKVASKSYLVTTAHDEAPFYFVRTYAPIFHSLKGIIFLSEAEKQLVNHVYKVPPHVQQIVGGIGVPQRIEFSEQQFADLDRAFQQKIGKDPYVLYIGRIAPAKGCREMIDSFIEFRQRCPTKVTLVLVGSSEIDIPDHEFIKYLGYVDEREKSYLIQRSVGIINPSHLESFSIVIMEAWEHGVPVIVNAASEVMKSYCDQSNAGLYYYSKSMLHAILEWSVANKDLREQLGQQGQKFVRKIFSNERIRQKLLEEISPN